VKEARHKNWIISFKLNVQGRQMQEERKWISGSRAWRVGSGE
jgi:hypothetical protein